MEIILLRHGKPVIPHLNKLSASEFNEWVSLYNASGLCTSSTPTNEAIDLAKKCNAIVCSELPRSIQSAKALNINDTTLTHSLFNEAGLPIATWSHPRLSPKIWAVIFRIFWICGYSYNSESFKEAKKRAFEATNILKALAKQHNSVLYVGHGVFNRLIANELNASGWTGPKNPGSKHWSHSVYKYKK